MFSNLVYMLCYHRYEEISPEFLLYILFKTVPFIVPLVSIVSPIFISLYQPIYYVRIKDTCLVLYNLNITAFYRRDLVKKSCHFTCVLGD